MGRQARFDIRSAYARAMRAKGGALPTVRDVALLIGATADLTRYHLIHQGLPYARMTTSEAGRVSAGAASRQAEDRLLTQHAAFVAQNGRLPTRQELNMAMGMAPESRHVDRMAKRLGLELARARREHVKDKDVVGEEPRVRADAPTDAVFRFGGETSPRMDKILALQNGTDPGDGNGPAQRPGVAYASGDRIMITCPVCGMRKLIAPRMHPYWIRNKAGAVIFVCREACTGRVTGG